MRNEGPLRTRFAPSPTGDLHLGGALCAVVSYWIARRSGGAFVMRVEDLDPPRVVAGSAARILEDLAWLGLDWDEGPVLSSAHASGVSGERGPFGPYAQSKRGALYGAAVETLRSRGLVYPCDCSRAEIARAASAPHAGEDVVYPGTCRDADPNREFKRPPALRVRVPEGEAARVSFVDDVAGPFTQRLDESVGDFVLVRGDGVYAYQLAVIVDDLAMRVSHVVRGADLLASTPRQLWLARELGAREDELPRYSHLPLVVDHEGERLQKRSPGAHVRALREAGVGADEIVGVLAHAAGLVPAPAPLAVRDLLRVDEDAARAPFALTVPRAWAQRVESDR